MKDDVIIEFTNDKNPEEVTVYLYDKMSGDVTGEILEVTTKVQAYKDYNVIGVYFDGVIRNRDEDMEEEDDSDYLGVEEEDEDY